MRGQARRSQHTPPSIPATLPSPSNDDAVGSRGLFTETQEKVGELSWQNTCHRWLEQHYAVRSYKGAIMSGSRMFVATSLALLVVVAPASAQHRGGGGRVRGGAVVVGRAAPRGEVRGGPRGYAAPRVYAAPRAVRVAPMRFYRPYYTFRPHLSIGVGLFVGYPVRYTSYYGYYDPFYYSYYPPGYAYPYPYRYPYPYSYPSPYPAYPPPAYPPTAYPPSAYPSYPPGSPQPAYPPSGYTGSTQTSYPQSGYPPQGSISPSQPNTGGISFEMQPSDAQIYVDGRYVGTVGQFSPTSQPLGLTAGRHHIRITAPGYRSMEFDADIVGGEVLPYQGALER